MRDFIYFNLFNVFEQDKKKNKYENNLLILSHITF